MNCEKCGNANEKDARFCRHCGEPIAEIGGVKGEKVFVADKPRSEGGFLCFGEEEESEWKDSYSYMIIGIVFISVSVIISLAMIGFFENFGNTIGNFFGDFGTNMGKIGEDIGEFFSNWGSNFGTSVENFFGGTAWWEVLQYALILFFLLIGIIMIVRGYQKNK